jgi:hypothetical protein
LPAKKKHRNFKPKIAKNKLRKSRGFCNEKHKFCFVLLIFFFHKNVFFISFLGPFFAFFTGFEKYFGIVNYFRGCQVLL